MFIRFSHWAFNAILFWSSNWETVPFSQINSFVSFCFYVLMIIICNGKLDSPIENLNNNVITF